MSVFWPPILGLLGNLAQTTKVGFTILISKYMDLNSWKVSQRNIDWNFPNIISKIMQHNGLLAKHTIVYLFKINQRTRRASNDLTSDKISNCEQISMLQTSILLTEINAMSDAFFEI